MIVQIACEFLHCEGIGHKYRTIRYYMCHERQYCITNEHEKRSNGQNVQGTVFAVPGYTKPFSHTLIPSVIVSDSDV